MKLIDAKDWKAVHFKDRTILRSDRNLYPEADWWALVSTVDVEPMKEPGHFKVVVGVLHQLLEGVLIELDHILGGAGRRHDAAGGTQPLVIVAKLPLFLS